MTDFPLTWIRAQYPALGSAQTDRIFLDNASGSQVPRHVIDAVVHTLTTMNVNKGGAYGASERVTAAKEAVRAQVAAFLNAPPRNVVFGPNATTLVELLAQSFGKTLAAGDEIVVSGLEHHANRDPWRRLEARGVVVKAWPVSEDEARLELHDLEPLLTPKTRLVTLTAASNALGTTPDVSVVSARVHALEALPAPKLTFLEGADPVAWEPGTQNHEAIVGFGGTFAYLDEVAAQLGIQGSGRAAWAGAFAAFATHETALLTQLLAGLDDLGATRYGLTRTQGRTATVSFNLGAHTPQAVTKHLAGRSITAASGHYYAYDLMMRQLGLAERGGAVRLSILHYNSPDDVADALAALAELA